MSQPDVSVDFFLDEYGFKELEILQPDPIGTPKDITVILAEPDIGVYETTTYGNQTYLIRITASDAWDHSTWGASFWNDAAILHIKPVCAEPYGK